MWNPSGCSFAFATTLLCTGLMYEAYAFSQTTDSRISSSASSGESATGADNKMRGADRAFAANQPIGRRLALMIGINYSDISPEKHKSDQESKDSSKFVGNSITPLDACESDALQFKEALIKYYGYQEGDVKTLIGSEATETEIRRMLGTAWLCADDVNSNDSILVYFAGHGDAIVSSDTEKQSQGYLFPIDVRKNELSASALKVRNVVDEMRASNAGQKLLILDCCHAGAIFSEGFNLTDNDVDSARTRSIAQNSPTFQVITASRADETASDTKSYTKALLKALETVPSRVPESQEVKGLKIVTTSQLWQSSRVFLEQSGIKQSPQCRWLAHPDSEFAFYPDPNAKFAQNIDRDKQEKLLLAMVPSTFGKWWFDEVPWFMPSLRLQITEHLPKDRSVAETVDFEKIKDAANRLWKVSLDGEIQTRLRHMTLLMQSKSNADRRRGMRQIAVELAQMRADNSVASKTLQAADIHFEAVLWHKLGEGAQASKLYQRALDEYAELFRNSAEANPLEALCKLDYGYFLLSYMDAEVLEKDAPDADVGSTEVPNGELNVQSHANRALLARKNFRQARETFGPMAPYPFQIFTLISESKALASAGKSNLAEDLLNEASNLLGSFDPKNTHLFTAAAYNDMAWHYMTLWQFSRARTKFTSSRSVLANISDKEFELAVTDFHIRHGLAMIDRYLGRPDLALQSYRTLTPDIATKIHRLDMSKVVDESYLELRSMLVARLCNSLERQGDCNLVSPKPNYGEAADDFRRAAIEEADPVLKCRYQFKRALALSLEGSVSEVEYAQALFEKTKAVYDKGQSDQFVSFCRDISEIVIKHQRQRTEKCEVDASGHETQGSTESCRASDELRSKIKTYRAKFAESIPRDDLELMMFASNKLLDWHTSGYQQLTEMRDRLQVEEDADFLLSLCKLAYKFNNVRASDPNDQAFDANDKASDPIVYLRPYYESIFLAKASCGTMHNKELLEIAWEATRGEAFMKPQSPMPILVILTIAGKQHYIFDDPLAKCTLFTSEEIFSPDQLRNASTESGSKLTLPDKLRKAIRDCGHSRLFVHWRDPVLLLGYKIISETTQTISKDSDKSARPRVRVLQDKSAAMPFIVGIECDETSDQ